jgi:hypothetical protein
MTQVQNFLWHYRTSTIGHAFLLSAVLVFHMYILKKILTAVYFCVLAPQTFVNVGTAILYHIWWTVMVNYVEFTSLIPLLNSVHGIFVQLFCRNM